MQNLGAKKCVMGMWKKSIAKKILATFTHAKFSPLIGNLHNQTIESINVKTSWRPWMLKSSVFQETWPIFFIQPLGLTVKGEAKKLMTDQNTTGTSHIWSQDTSYHIWNKTKGNLIQELPPPTPDQCVDIDLKLSILKPMHTTWIVSLYNHLTSRKGKR